MRKYKLCIFMILFLLIAFYCSIVQSASLNLSTNKSNVDIGDEFTVSVNLSGANLVSMDIRVSVDTSKVEYLSSTEPNNSNFSNGRILYTWVDSSGGANPKTSGTIVTFRFKAKSAGIANFSVSGSFFDVNENSVSLSLSGTSIKINEQEPENPPVTPETPSNNNEGEQNPNENNQNNNNNENNNNNNENEENPPPNGNENNNENNEPNIEEPEENEPNINERKQ